MKSKLELLKEQEVYQVHIGDVVYEMVKISQAEVAMERYLQQPLIREYQVQALEDKIYSTLIALPEMGLGEIGDCKDEAKRIVNEWIEENKIQILTDNVKPL